MAKKKKFQETTIENYYDLKVDKVDELVAILKGDDPEEFGEISMNISDCTGVYDPKNVKRNGKEKQFDPYKTDFLGKIPTWIKAIFIKWWFAGVICYFVNMGLGIYITDTLDLIVVCGLVMGLAVELLVNPIFRFMESDRREFNAYMMFPFPFKAFWTLFTNMLYYIVVVMCVNYLYLGLNELINIIMHTDNYIHAGVEPLLFGIFCVIVDMIFIGIKDAIVFAVKHSRKKESTVNV